MITRAVDGNNDWLFGRSKQDYKVGRDAVAQNIKTRLQSFLGDCFFSLEDGIDWFNLLGSKQTLILSLNIQAVILNTPEVVKLTQIDFTLNASRNLLLTYEVLTIYGVLTQEDFLEVQTYIDDPNENLILQDGDNLLQQDDGLLLLQGGL